MSNKNRSQHANEQTVCRYDLSHDSSKISMITHCKYCKGNADLKDPLCLSGVLKGLYEEYNVDFVILSHYIETKYTHDSMEILNMMVEIIQDLDQLAIRDPYEEIFKPDEKLSSQIKNQRKLTCEKCRENPSRIFIRLKDSFVLDISRFYDDLKDISSKVARSEKEECEICVNATQSDILYLFNKLEKLRSYVIYKGFRIVI